jgi:hypothetical protein
MAQRALDDIINEEDPPFGPIAVPADPWSGW